jgi:hypothetical protein
VKGANFTRRKAKGNDAGALNNEVGAVCAESTKMQRFELGEVSMLSARVEIGGRATIT